MKEIIISKCEKGMRLDRYIRKLFVKMPISTFHKLLRKKYFEINDVKANGREVLCEGDKLTIFLSNETFDKFTELEVKPNNKDNIKLEKNESQYDRRVKDKIVYEDNNVIIYDKEVGILSQCDRSNDVSVNTILNDYLGNINNNDIFRPSIVNRLDRNTRGLIIFAKTYIAAKEISSMIRDGRLDKYYLTYVNGSVKKDHDIITHLLKKDTQHNKVKIIAYNGKVVDGYKIVSLEYKVLKREKDISLLQVRLITGKSHQIRAELSYIGHPLLGDKKYMDINLYRNNVNEYGVKTQSLISYKLKFGEFSANVLKNLSNKEIILKIED